MEKLHSSLTLKDRSESQVFYLQDVIFIIMYKIENYFVKYHILAHLDMCIFTLLLTKSLLSSMQSYCH